MTSVITLQFTKESAIPEIGRLKTSLCRCSVRGKLGVYKSLYACCKWGGIG